VKKLKIWSRFTNCVCERQVVLRLKKKQAMQNKNGRYLIGRCLQPFNRLVSGYWDMQVLLACPVVPCKT